MGTDPKPEPNRRIYLEILRRMTPEQRLAIACEMSDNVRDLFRQGLRAQHPQLDDAAFHRLFLQRLATCHNQNY